ncbi:hypothetical protein APSETT445_006682 [Aspergillus pseudonomiae]
MHCQDYISLDYTLHDLYGLDGGNGSNIALVLFNPFIGDSQLRSVDPPNERFVYDSCCDPDSGDDDENARLEQQVLPQRYGYTAGKIPVICTDVQKPGCCASQCNSCGPSDLFRVFQKLRESQRPIGKLVPSLADISIPQDCLVSVIAPSEDLSHLPHTINPDDHYELLSKRGLALSGLPMPKTMVVDSRWTPDLSLNGACLQTEIQRMLKYIDMYPAPYMVKLPQTVSGKGAFKVSSEGDRRALRTRLHLWLRHALKKVNASNQHLHHSSLVFQEFIQGSTMSLSLFVTKSGRPVFVTCSDQIFDKTGEWVGGTVSYDRQALLEKEYSIISKKVAQFLHGRGYYGPAGADVLTDECGRQYIVDLNVRPTGTYHFGPLKGHFTKRGLWEAMTLKIYLECSQAEFEDGFKEELRNGNIIIMGWAESESKNRSYSIFTLGAKDTSSLEQLAQSITTWGARD